jgi:predicted dienelactone hydrolase
LFLFTFIYIPRLVISLTRRHFFATLGAALLTRPTFSQQRVEPKSWLDLIWTDTGRKRPLQLRLRFPDTAPPWPMIVYSPGLGSGVTNGAAWCNAWRDAGLMVATVSHPQTNDDIWDTRRGNLRARLNVALHWAQLGHRVNDCRFVIDQWTQRADLQRFVDPRRIGVAGHSYGALTVQALAGQWYGGKPLYRDPRITAAIALSPGASPIDAAHGAAGITIPSLCVTGDQDGYVTFGTGEDAMRLGVPVENRVAVYNRMPPGEKHLLLLKGADHMTFAGEPVEGMPYSRAPGVTLTTDRPQWKKVNAITTQFWLRYLFPPAQDAKIAFAHAALGQLESTDRLESK